MVQLFLDIVQTGVNMVQMGVVVMYRSTDRCKHGTDEG